MRECKQPLLGSTPPSALSLRAGFACFLALLPFLIPTSATALDPRPAGKQHDGYDIRLALRCRRALGQDTELAPYGVCVSVRQGVAIVWGRLPNAALEQRAVQLVQGVPGVLQVRSDVAVGPVEPARDESPKLPATIALPHVGGPSSEREPFSNQNPRSRGVLAGNARHSKSEPADAAWMGRPEPRRKPEGDSGSAVVLLPPRPAEKGEDLASAVARLVASDVRFAGVRGEERSGIVILSGRVARMDDVLELARQVSRVAGVKEVVVQSVRVAPP